MPLCLQKKPQRQMHDAWKQITRTRIAHATNESMVSGDHVMVRWSCDLPPHLKLALASMSKIRNPPYTVGEVSWNRRA